MSTYLTEVQNSNEFTSNLDTPSRALAIGAHPDDIEFGCGGTLAKWAKAGCEIFHLVCTDGSKGTWDSEVDGVALAKRRQLEQTQAAKTLGGNAPVIFLGWIDGELDSGMTQRAQVVSAIRDTKPDIVLAHDPWKRYRLHPDHRNAGYLATDGVVAARDPLFFPELGRPHRPSKILLWEADAADHYESIDEETFLTKIDALKCHASQYETTMGVNQLDDQTQMDTFIQRLRDRMSSNPSSSSSQLREVFKLISRV